MDDEPLAAAAFSSGRGVCVAYAWIKNQCHVFRESDRGNLRVGDLEVG